MWDIVLIQMMAAAVTSRDLIYFTFNDVATVQKLTQLNQLIVRADLSVGQVYALLLDYGQYLKQIDTRPQHSTSDNTSLVVCDDLCQYFSRRI